MAETKALLKRPREETQVEEELEIIEETKRQRPYHDILSILEAEEEEPPQDDLSSLMATLQEELSSESSDPLPETTAIPLELESINPPSTTAAGSSEPSSSSTTSGSPLRFQDFDEEEEKGMSTHIIRHLLEASDDELGIPQTQIRFQTSKYEDEEVIHSDGLGGLYFGDISNEEGRSGISFYGVHEDGLWDFEDEAANYYTLLQSELFM
ncbi:hypothetical protein NE237_020214 [Protea cynaroides]|uniref:Uncharacterized protein n=1 Tax=Protea cynaroides TaxID=273540 RepID=A0A9Q0K1F8_9MAGN|nr:hypothetical protein NE237_020214 [Protea cynaroides]